MMELRQIIRNQKLSNFNLLHLIKEADSDSFEESRTTDEFPESIPKDREKAKLTGTLEGLL